MNFSKFYKDTLLKDIIPFWEKYSIDNENGGYFTCLDTNGNVYDTDKFIWLQGRQAWTFSMLYNKVEKNEKWLAIAKNGIDFLRKYGMNEKGDFYFSVTKDGKPLVQAYNIFSDCFAAMAFSQYAIASGDDEVRELAKKTYFNILNRIDEVLSSQPKKIFILIGTNDLARGKSVDYILIDTSQVLKTNFNDYTRERIWVVIEEKEDSGKKKDNIGSTIKYVTGNKKRVVEGKGKDRKEIEDYNNYIFTTNETNPGLDLKEHDRRASVFGYSRALGGHRNKAPEIRLKLEREIPNELDNFVSYLKNLEFDMHEVFVSYETEARNNLVSLDVDNVGLFVQQIKSQYSDSLFNYILDDIQIPFTQITIITHNNETWFLAKDIYLIYKRFSNINEKQITAENRFFPRFYNLTNLNLRYTM